MCMHTAKSFRINQTARSMPKHRPRYLHRERVGISFLSFIITLQCIWRTWNIFPAATDKEFFSVALKIFRLEEATSAKRRAINILHEQCITPKLLLPLFQCSLENSFYEWDFASSKEPLHYPTSKEDWIIGLSPVYQLKISMSQIFISPKGIP